MTQGKEIYISFMTDVNPRTTEQLLGLIFQKVNQEGVTKVTLMLNSSGGNVNCGIAIYNELRALPIEIVTHNVGNADSIAVIIFLAGEKRYACESSTFMFHGTVFNFDDPTRLDQKLLNELLSGLTADDKRTADIISSRTNIDAKEIFGWHRVGKTVDVQFAKQNGIIDDIRDVSIPPGVEVIQLVFH